MTTADARRFLGQNEEFAESLTPADLEVVDLYAEHHAGGLFVLWRWISDDLSVKAHESWGGDDEEGNGMVVHVYSTEDDSVDIVNYYATGHEAVHAFLLADEDTTEH